LSTYAGAGGAYVAPAPAYVDNVHHGWEATEVPRFIAREPEGVDERGGHDDREGIRVVER
jgi:hypothetical protein